MAFAEDGMGGGGGDGKPPRVVVCDPFHSPGVVSVCAVNEATDKELIDACNDESVNPLAEFVPCYHVLRKGANFMGIPVPERGWPVKCGGDPECRTHYLVAYL